uniref:Uncharacterized protein n=1 Tax=Romanomermis culicivorax TaxID=13658 RepID=A0A915JKP4_ROMCU
MFRWYKPLIKLLAPSLINFKPNSCAFNVKSRNRLKQQMCDLPPLPKKMQQLISTRTVDAAMRNNLPTLRPWPVTSQFHGEKPRNINITSNTFRETEPVLA